MPELSLRKENMMTKEFLLQTGLLNLRGFLRKPILFQKSTERESGFLPKSNLPLNSPMPKSSQSPEVTVKRLPHP